MREGVRRGGAGVRHRNVLSLLLLLSHRQCHEGSKEEPAPRHVATELDTRHRRSVHVSTFVGFTSLASPSLSRFPRKRPSLAPPDFS